MCLMSGFLSLVLPKSSAKCMFVCLRWAHIISTLSLFHIIAIQNEPKIGRFLHYMEQNRGRAKQVENLTLLGCIDLDLNFRKLVSLFPNLESIELSSVLARGSSSAMAFNRDETQIPLLLQNCSTRLQSLTYSHKFQITTFPILISRWDPT
jgi:hypothetical protein